MNEYEAAACYGKEAFDDVALAHRVAARARKSKNASLRAYKCKACGRIHIGTFEAKKVKPGGRTRKKRPVRR